MGIIANLGRDIDTTLAKLFRQFSFQKMDYYGK